MLPKLVKDIILKVHWYPYFVINAPVSIEKAMPPNPDPEVEIPAAIDLLDVNH